MNTLTKKVVSMKKKLILGLLVLLGLTAGNDSPMSFLLPRAHGPLLHLKDEEGRPMCTGFVIDDNYAITAAHCVYGKGGKNITAKDHANKDPIQTRVVGYYARGDYALLKADFTTYARFKIEQTHPLGRLLEGRMVATCGFPLGQLASACNPAMILSPMDSFFLAKGELYPGMSGGPVIEPTTGLVVGLNSASWGEEFSQKFVDAIVISPLTGLAAALNVE